MMKPLLAATRSSIGQRLRRAFIACATVCLIGSAAAHTAYAEGIAYAIRAGRIMPVAPDMDWVIEHGVIIVRDGQIVAIGHENDVDIPHGMRVLEMPDATIMPGFVAASGNVTAHVGEETISADHRAVDGFDIYGDYRDVLSGGVTTLHVGTGWQRLVSGQGAVTKLGGDPATRMLDAANDLTVNLGPGAYGPPGLVEYLVPAVGDSPIKPAEAQRPGSRVSQILALREAISAAQSSDREPGAARNIDALAEAWADQRSLRIQAQSSVDLEAAISFLAANRRDGYLVGGWEADAIADRLDDTGVSVVYTIDGPRNSPGPNRGANPNSLRADIQVLATLPAEQLALATMPGQSVASLRLAASTALRAGLSERTVIEAITRVPARLLGVSDRVGSLEPGKDADFLVLNGHPLETTTHVQEVFINGLRAFKYPVEADSALVVKGGTIWLGPNEWLEDGSILIENGKITSVGKRVASPPHAKVVEVSDDAFITPGLIDAFGHLGLDGDQSPVPPAISLARLVGAPDQTDLMVARAGITTVLTAPYRFGGQGSQAAAIKTAGDGRDDRIVRPTAAVGFDVRSQAAEGVAGRLRPRLEAGKKYKEKWEAYEKELAEWEKKRAEGTLEAGDGKAKVVEDVSEEAEVDPVTGSWDIRISGEPLQGEVVEGKIALTLKGDAVEGRIIEPYVPIDVKLVGTLTGNTIKGVVEVDVPGGPGTPYFEITVENDQMSGTAGIEGLAVVDVEGERTSKEAVEFKVTRKKRKTTGKDGRPLPPPVDEALEPIKAMLESKIPAIVSVQNRDQIDAVLNVLVDQYKVPVVLLNAEEAHKVSTRIKDSDVGVVLPPSVLRREDNAWVHQGDTLSRDGVRVAFQSNAEDAASALPMVALYAVERGMSAEDALSALTIHAATMLRLDDHVGTIAPGRDGDIVIFNGYPFDAGTSVQRVFVKGEEVDQ